MKKIDELLQELENKKNEMRSFLESNEIDKAKAVKEELRLLKEKVELQKEIDEEEQREAENKIETRKGEKKMDKREEVKDLEFRAIGKYLLKSANRDVEMSEEERASVNVGNSGAILPQGFVNQVQTLIKGFPALKPYTHVIPVTTNTGKMPISKGSTTKKLAKLAVDAELVKEMIETEPINYAVEDYGKIYPIENSVLEDTGVEFFNGLLAPDVAECSVNSENAEIISVVTTNATAFTATDYKGIIKCLNTKIVPSLLSKTIVITNQDGYDYLDNISDTTGRPLLSDSLAVPGGKTLKGREIVVLDNADLTPVTAGKKPFYVVNLFALIKFFDRKQYEMNVSKDAGFTYNQVLARVIERFDVVKGDTRACYYIEF